MPMSDLPYPLCSQRLSSHQEIIERLRAAEFHWHFVQGIQALNNRLYVPGCIALICGIEASLRRTLAHVEDPSAPYVQGLGAVLNNQLLRQCHNAGLPVHVLAFKGEHDFLSRLARNSPRVEIVRLRHNLAHGEVGEFISTAAGPEIPFFTPDCLRPISHRLRHLTMKWVRHLSRFRRDALGI